MPERLSKPEFIALMAMMFATIAFSLDAMLPALPEIAEELSPDVPNRAQLILTSFVLGMGIGTMFTGPLSDAFGRRRVIFGGVALYILGAAIAVVAPSLEMMVAARILQGIGAAGPRIVAIAIIRDLYGGRTMAQLMSFVMMVFTLIPAFAPTLGAGLIWAFGWRAIFIAFMIFGVFAVLWLALRQRETLDPAHRRPFKAAVLWAGIVEVLSHPMVSRSVLVQTLIFGMLFTTLSVTQPIFDVTFGEGDRFHLWFGGIALVSASASLVNAKIVMRLGMERVVTGTLAIQIVISSVMLAATLLPTPDGLFFWLYVFWTTSLFSTAGLTIGNVNAMAMEPMAHLAGMSASIIGSVATVGAVLIAVPVGLSFDGTPLWPALGVVICACLAFGIMRQLADHVGPSAEEQET
ncbi:MAG: multidrug effflux MFS transporter [Pseudomonadota bacterium]